MQPGAAGQAMSANSHRRPVPDIKDRTRKKTIKIQLVRVSVHRIQQTLSFQEVERCKTLRKRRVVTAKQVARLNVASNFAEQARQRHRCAPFQGESSLLPCEPRRSLDTADCLSGPN